MFDNNDYANDPRKQFMNWALMANAAWDYPQRFAFWPISIKDASEAIQRHFTLQE